MIIIALHVVQKYVAQLLAIFIEYIYLHKTFYCLSRRTSYYGTFYRIKASS